jgi:hypothetical protein
MPFAPAAILDLKQMPVVASLARAIKPVTITDLDIDAPVTRGAVQSLVDAVTTAHYVGGGPSTTTSGGR